MDLIVIGGGPGGYEAALHAAGRDKKVLLAEKGRIGGTCLNVGCIPTKVFLKSAHIYRKCAHAADYGVETGNPVLDMQKVQKRKKKIVARLTKGVEGLLKRNGVKLVRGHAEFTSPETVSVNGEQYTARNILIASGSKPAVPPVKGIDSPSVLNSTHVLDLTEIPESIIIIGAGVIGLEFADFFSSTGTRVTVLEMLPRAGAGISEDVAKRLTASLRKQGVTFSFSSTVNAVSGNSVAYTDAGGCDQETSAEYILNATGRKPVVRHLGLDAAGVHYSQKGIPVSDNMRTNKENIWACGDVTGTFMLAHVASMEGICAVDNMFSGQSRVAYRAVPNVIYSSPEAVSTGQTEEQLTESGTAFDKKSVPMGVSGKFLIENENQNGLVKVLTEKETGRILGVHMLGDSSSEMAFGASHMIQKEITADSLRNVIFPHPTVSEALMQALR